MTDPVRDMDERLNIEGEPADVLRALFAIDPCDVEAPNPLAPKTGDEAIDRLLDNG